MNKYIVACLVAVALMVVGCSEVSTGDATGKTEQTEKKTVAKRKKASKKYTGSSAPAGRRMLAEDFSSSLRSGATVVYFAKIACPSCKKQDEIWKKAVKKLPSGVKGEKRFTYAVNYRAYGVTQLPTMVFYKDGVEVGRHVGVMQQKDIFSQARKAL